jgi:CheY-like chemotaxis protein
MFTPLHSAPAPSGEARSSREQLSAIAGSPPPSSRTSPPREEDDRALGRALCLPVLPSLSAGRASVGNGAPRWLRAHLARCCNRAHELGAFARSPATHPIRTGMVGWQPMSAQRLSKLLARGLADELLRTLRKRGRGVGGVSEEVVPSACSATPREDGHRTQVLIIDRDREVVELLAYILRRADIAFQAVHDAAGALSMLSTWQPRVVILDSYDRDMLQQLRAHSDDLAIIVLRPAESDHAGTTVGVTVADYLTKPFSCADLVASIRACLLRDSHQSLDLRHEPLRRSR